MKIAIVVPIVGNFGRKGFYQSQEIGLGKTLCEMRHEVTIYKCVPVDAFEKVEKETLKGITVIYIPTKNYGPHGMLDVELIDKDSEVAFTFSDTQLIIRKLYKYCKKYRIRFIPYVGIAHSFKKDIKAKVMDMLYRNLTLPVYKKCTVVAKTIAAEKELEAQGVKKCLVAPVGIDLSSLKQNYESYDRVILREKWGFDKEDTIISFVARLQPEKRPLDLIDIFDKAELKRKKLLIVGKGPLAEEIERKVKEKGLTDKVVIISELPYISMWEIHYISDYFLNLRTDEIFGMAVMEAVYYKSSVIARRAPGPETILAGMEAHYICDSDEEMIEVLNYNKIDIDVLEVEKNLLVEKFSWAACANTIIDIGGFL